MFQSIKAALSKEDAPTPGLYNEILKTEVGNTYVVRLLPYAADPSKTFHQYYNFGWESFATGNYVQATSPATFGERCPISEERFRLTKNGSAEEKERIDKVRRSTKWYVNVFVIDDPKNPENNGKNKILRYGKQLEKIIMNAISGDDADEYGERIFDLGPNGVDLKIKVEKQAEYPTYVSSRFTSSKLKLSEDKQKEILEHTYDLTAVNQVKSYEELQEMFNEHFWANLEPSATKTKTVAKPKAENKVPVVDNSDDQTEADIDALLKDL